MIDKKYYLYLIKCSNKFKVGITSDPKKRNAQYKVHNLNYKFEGVFEVPDRKIEKLIHYTILKRGFKRCNTYKEWFEGSYSLNDLKEDIERYKQKEVSDAI